MFYEQGEGEAKILLHLKHPGIPILYDLFDDGQTLYILEEYVQGQSLTEYLLYHNISQKQCRNYAIQLCEILEYLHKNKLARILYQDMKAEHIIVQGDCVRLIDFGNASQNSAKTIYGTEGYVAPEVLRGLCPTEKSDLYSLAKTMAFAVESSGLKGKEIRRILDAGLDPEVETRVDVKVWKQMWMDLQEKNLVYEGASKVIAVVGNAEGAGCTHVAISLTMYLSELYGAAYYRNPKETEDVLENIMRNTPVWKEKDDIIYHNGFYGIRTFGRGVETTNPPDGIQVLDCGTDIKMAKTADFIVYVCTSCLWKDQRIWPLSEEVGIILCNPENRGAGRNYARSFGKKVYGFPLDADAFQMTKEKKKILARIGKELKP